MTPSYLPQIVKIDSVGVGVSEETNLSLGLSSTQYMVVGEFLKPSSSGGSCNAYNMIIDNEGVAIRTSLQQRRDMTNEYALYVDGDVYLTGRLLACNIISNSNMGGVGSGDSYWRLSTGAADNLYYANKVTLGNEFQATNNTYTLNVSKSADYTIDHAQFAIQNTQLSRYRTAILGNAASSPAVINTTPGTKLEFHVGRDDDYFYPRYYSASNWITNVDPHTGCNISVLQIDYSDVPVYRSSSEAPHLVIHEDGNVGIHTSFNPVLTYQQRVRRSVSPYDMIFVATSNAMDLHVQGSTYTHDLLIWDAESNMAKNIDELYVRRMGVSLAANKIEAGSFAVGDYMFPTTLSIAGPKYGSNQLTVNGNAYISDSLTIQGTTRMQQLVTEDAILLDVASFCNDAYVNRDMIVNQSLRVRGQIMVEVLCNVDGGQSNYMWQMINFSPASPSLSNINLIGQGIATPGRLGAGIHPNKDEVNHQFVVMKRDPFDAIFNNMFEMELTDATSSKWRKTAFIGHPLPSAERVQDGSIVFATPATDDPFYTGVYDQFPQNFYFFPGTDMTPSASPVVRDGNVPTLNIHHTQKLGVRTYSPTSELDVRGTITFSDKLRKLDPNTNEINEVGIWETRTFANPLPTGPTTFVGLQYYNPQAPYIGVHKIPDIRYGMTVAGATKLESIYNSDDRRGVLFLDSGDSNTVTNNVAPATSFGLFTWGNVGIGVKSPTATVEIKDNYQSSYGTQLKLVRGDTAVNPSMSIQFMGAEPWTMRMDDALQRFDLGRTSSNINDARAVWMKYNTDLQNYQVVMGANNSVLSYGSSNPNINAVLTVGGDMSVLGDVNITGKFRINSQVVSGSALSNALPTFGSDDVFIGGGHILLRPAFGKTLLVGNLTDAETDPLNNGKDNQSLLRIYQEDGNKPIVASFRANGNVALMKLAAGAREVRFGVLGQDALYDMASFGFVDENNRPYLSFKGVAQNGIERNVGFNTFDPLANIHVVTAATGSNMLRLTKTVVGLEDTTSACPEIDFQKMFSETNSTRTWTIRGPDASFQDKLGFNYSVDNQRTEIYTFTNNGCFGIGNSTPTFALDVRSQGKQGTLRLLNTDAEGAPQIVFQTGDAVYGGDQYFDYRMTTSNSEFRFDSQSVDDSYLLMHVASNGNMGFRTTASSEDTFTFKGSVNVTDAILLNGNPLFLAEGQSYEDALVIRSKNIFLRPKPAFEGGIIINSCNVTGNLFHIFSGYNCNMMVFDSAYEEAQLHFRVRESYAVNAKQNMYRLGMALDSFYLEYNGDCSNALQIESGHAEYDRVFRVLPSQRASVASNVFDLSLQGQYYSIAPEAGLRMVTDGLESMVGGSNGHAFLYAAPSCNVGIGTTRPLARTHVYTSSSSGTAALRVQQAGSDKLLDLYTSTGQTAFMDGSGHLNLHQQMYLANGTATLPAYSFQQSTGTGLYLSAADTLSVVTQGQPRLTISDQGRATMNATLSITSNLADSNRPLVSMTQQGSGDALRIATNADANALVIHSNANIGIGTAVGNYKLHVECAGGAVGLGGHLYPTSNIAYNLGASNARWKDLYLSGNTIDMDGTKITREVDGSLRVDDGSGLQRIITKELQIGASNTMDSNIVLIRSDPLSGVTFTIVNPFTNTSNTIAPITTSGAIDTAVSIGVKNPLATLHVVTSNLPAFRVEQRGSCNLAEWYGTNNVPALFVNAIGNIGIGTTTVTYPFQIVASNVTTAARVAQYGSGDILRLQAPNAGAAAFVQVDGRGYLGVQTPPSYPLHVKGYQYFDGRSTFTSNVYMAANLEVQGNAVTHGDAITDSDLRLKTDLVRIDGALDKVSALTGYTFNKKHDHYRRGTGLIAQDVLKVLPEAVATDGEYLGVAYGNLMGLIVEAIKDLKNEIKEIKQHVGL